MTRFKIGDRVLWKGLVGNKALRNAIGTVIKCSRDEFGDSYLVEFDEDIGGTSGSGSGKPNHCWWVGDDIDSLIPYNDNIEDLPDVDNLDSFFE